MLSQTQKHSQILKNMRMNLVFVIQLFTVFLVATGTIERWWIIPLAILVSLYALFANLSSATLYFIRAVPIFVAIPLTAYFDNFNLWRIFSGLVFLRWFFDYRAELIDKLRSALARPKAIFKKYPLLVCFAGFILASILSLIVADLFIGLKRLIFILNLSLIAPVIFTLIRDQKLSLPLVFKNIIYAGVIVMAVGVIQLISAYLVDFWTFMEYWARMVQYGFYGFEWSGIAYTSNTWFAYLSDQLSLRVFSTLPDSHSFPVVLLFVLPALFAVAVYPILRKLALQSDSVRASNLTLKRLYLTRGNLLMVLIPLAYLLLILSGTRGIWLASLAPLLIAPFALRFLNYENKNVFKYLISFWLLFFMLFSVAWPIFSSSQFQIDKSEGDELFKRRIRSILDLGETSNLGRILIWKETVRSIGQNPLFGVGIGNFPVILGQGQDASLAGSSAHNLYLHIAAETGLLGLIFALRALLLVLWGGWVVFRDTTEYRSKLYGLAFSLYFLWILAYLMTDAVLFDERAFLMFVINASIIWALKKEVSTAAVPTSPKKPN